MLSLLIDEKRSFCLRMIGYISKLKIKLVGEKAMLCQSTSLTVTIIIDRMSLSKAPPLSSSPYNKSVRTFVYTTTRQKRVTRGPCDYTNTKSPLSLSQQRLVNVEEVIFTYSSNSIKNQNIKRELMQQD